MKIAILGYGKMGKEIEAIAMEKGHEIILKVDRRNRSTITKEALKTADVAIEFSRPESAIENMLLCFAAGIPVITGTTGWYGSFDEVVNDCQENNGALLHATNFSVGVNIFFELNKQLAKILNNYPEYTPVITEIHHTEKLDSPSGTAITIANGIIENHSNKTSWVNHSSEEVNELPIISEREENVPGTHMINYQSPIDDISIKHTAHNRKGFALGAVVAAEWIQHKKGVFTMSDMLNVNFS